MRHVGQRFLYEDDRTIMLPYTTADLFAFVDMPGRDLPWQKVDKMRFAFRVRNVTNTLYAQWSDPGYPDQVYLGAPRTFELSASANGDTHHRDTAPPLVGRRVLPVVCDVVRLGHRHALRSVSGADEAERFAGLARGRYGCASTHGPAEAVRASGIKDAARVRLLQRADGPVYLVSGHVRIGRAPRR